jgi:tripartite-type tricarboxylate transporter receptor subunit TctC
MTRRRGALLIAAALAGASASPAAAPAQPAADFYRGRTMSLVVGSGEGGGFDLSARLTAPFLTRHIPGRPTIVVQNMPGASGLRAAEYLANLAPRDGSVIAITQPSIVLDKALNPAARFDPLAYAWIGRLATFTTFGVVWHTAPVQSIAEARARELIVGAVGPSGPAVMLPAALNRLAGTKLTIVKGYKSAADLGLAIERGEVQGSGSSALEYVAGKGWLERKLARLIYTIGLARDARAADVPTVVELVPDAGGKDIMRLAAGPSAIGRSIIAPPGLPTDRAAALRQAFGELVSDPEFIAESARRGLDLDPLAAAGLRAIVADAMAMPADVVAGLRAIAEGER